METSSAKVALHGGDVVFETNVPVEFPFARFESKAPPPGASDPYQQHLEPEGYYVAALYGPPDKLPPPWRAGVVTSPDDVHEIVVLDMGAIKKEGDMTANKVALDVGEKVLHLGPEHQEVVEIVGFEGGQPRVRGRVGESVVPIVELSHDAYQGLVESAMTLLMGGIDPQEATDVIAKDHEDVPREVVVDAVVDAAERVAS